jgi:CDP-6-deoxy-D-xylo-4-hexulose-3-dehydrase
MKKQLRVPYGQAVHNDKESQKVLQVLQEHRTIMGQETTAFEKSISKIFGKKYGIMVNSGSSANLLAIELLKLPEGSEVITPILTFATTIAPLIQKDIIPVFTDVEPGKYTVNISQIEKLITKKTKALFIPLLLGNVPDMNKLNMLCKKYDLILIEDSCDTLGATFEGKPTGEFSDITTTSFYGSHIITSGGNGGMILVNMDAWRDRAKELRGWGRSSSLYNETEDITQRFKKELDNIPYDSKFIFDEIGYNFLPNEIGAAFGNAQLEKLPHFRKTREKNFKNLYNFFSNYENFFTLPVQDPRVQTQWLAFPLTIKESAPFSRLEIVTYLEEHNIQTRPIFTGNVLKQPGFKNIPHKINETGYPVADSIMERGFVVGCHHGLEEKQIEYMKEVFETFIKR